MKDKLLELIRCSQTGEKLNLKEGELYSSKTSYPLFNDIPWLFKNPEFSFLDWGTKISQFINEEKSYLGFLALLSQSETNKLTLNRYQKIAEAKNHNIQIFQKYLRIFLGQKQINLMPSTQQIFSYYQLIFRDWCWETDEVDHYADYINSKINNRDINILVLGAGACGLSAKIAKVNCNSDIISCDHNPFLFMVANDIMNKQEIKLFDYTQFPKSLASCSRCYTIKQDQDFENHHFVLASFPDLPFEKNSFDMIITPWFLDILDLPFENALEHAKSYLKKDGEFISIGPANIHHKNIDQQLCSEEIIKIFENHFEKVTTDQKELDYLANPINSQNRKEEVLFISAQKSKKIEVIKEKDHKVEIKFTPAFEEYKQTFQVTTQILNLIDKDISQGELAQKLQKEFGFESAQAEFYAESFIRKTNLEI